MGRAGSKQRSREFVVGLIKGGEGGKYGYVVSSGVLLFSDSNIDQSVS